MEERRHSLALLPSSRSPRAALPSPELLHSQQGNTTCFYGVHGEQEKHPQMQFRHVG